MRLFNTGIESSQFRLRGQSPNQPVAADGNRDLVSKTPADFRALIEAAAASDVAGKQDKIYKWVFEAVYSTGTPSGWCRLGTLTGNSSSRFEIRLTGKDGWNDQNFASQSILHGGTNYIASDTGQIAAGCKWIESIGSSTTATIIALVRQAGYGSAKFDLYVYNNAGYVDWLVEVTTTAPGGWATSIAWNQTDPGTGTNVFRPTKRTLWDDGNLPVTAFAKTVLDDADAPTARSTLGAAPLASPTFTGTPAAPTASAGTNTTQLATTAFVRTEVAALVASAPGALDTLDELAAALGDDPNFATTVTNSLATKAVAADVNVGTTLEGASDPFHATQRFSAFDKRGGVRTWHGIGPFSASEDWYNVVDVTHRNGGGDGASGYGGVLAWGMTSNKTRMAFGSRAADGTYTWTEVLTKADIDFFVKGRIDFSTKINSDNKWSIYFRVGGFAWANNSGGTPVGEVWVGDRANPNAGNTASVQLSATRGYLSTGIPTNSAGEPNAGEAQVEWGPNGLHLNDLRRLTFSPTDFHAVNGADVTMTMSRAIITDSATRRVNLPPASEHSIAVVQVLTVPATKHRIYPQGSAVIYWHDFGGNSRATDSSGTETLRVPAGMYWFLSNGTDWTLMGPASNT